MVQEKHLGRTRTQQTRASATRWAIDAPLLLASHSCHCEAPLDDCILGSLCGLKESPALHVLSLPPQHSPTAPVPTPFDHCGVYEFWRPVIGGLCHQRALPPPRHPPPSHPLHSRAPLSLDGVDDIVDTSSTRPSQAFRNDPALHSAWFSNVDVVGISHLQPVILRGPFPREPVSSLFTRYLDLVLN
ncbi:hypothetical protein BGZ63DRAFT_421229 [Mariannaea sp. PMI_226]|nr:hypothetical protein BGZ63DRAFT_421229 [Mariannaea sp. PMI_226]